MDSIYKAGWNEEPLSHTKNLVLEWYLSLMGTFAMYHMTNKMLSLDGLKKIVLLLKKLLMGRDSNPGQGWRGNRSGLKILEGHQYFIYLYIFIYIYIKKEKN